MSYLLRVKLAFLTALCLPHQIRPLFFIGLCHIIGTGGTETIKEKAGGTRIKGMYIPTQNEMEYYKGTEATITEICFDI